MSIETGSPEQFDQLFAMPQVLIHWLWPQPRHSTRQLACLEDLPDALEWGLMVQGPALLRVSTNRRHDVGLRQRLRAAAQNELLTP